MNNYFYILASVVISILSWLFCREKIKNVKAQNESLKDKANNEKKAKESKQQEAKDIQKVKEEIKTEDKKEIVNKWNLGK